MMLARSTWGHQGKRDETDSDCYPAVEASHTLPAEICLNYVTATGK